MCDFISWIESKKDGKTYICYLDDEELFSERTRELLEGSRDNDFLGHHAIRVVHSLKTCEGREGECKDFWRTDQLPRELQERLKNFNAFRKNFGKMVTTYAQKDDLEYIVQNAPQTKPWQGLKKFANDTLKDWLVRKATIDEMEINCRYDLSIQELIQANRFRGYVDPNITDDHFPSKKSAAKKQQAVLLCLHNVATDQEVSEVMQRLKLQDGHPKELLSLGLDYPDLQKKFPIMARSSAWRGRSGRRSVPGLNSWYSERGLGVYWCDCGWSESCRFLAFRES